MTMRNALLVALALCVAACAKSDRHSDAVMQAGSARETTVADTARPATPMLTPDAAESAKAKPPSPRATTPGAGAQKVVPPQTGANAVSASASASANPPVSAPTVDTSRHAAMAAPSPAPATPGASDTSASDVAESVGKPAYQEYCRKCHGVRGVAPKTIQAKFPKIPAFDAAFDSRVSTDSIVTVLVRGVNDDMKSFKDKLTHEQMVALAAYIRQFGK